MSYGHFYDEGDAWGGGMGPMGMGGRPGNVNRRFDQIYRCYPVVMMPQSRDSVNYGGKVIMPPSALDKLTRLHISYPMIFEIRNASKKDFKHVTHAGVLEFIAEEGRIYLPHWMMTTLSLEPGHLIQILSTTLERGHFVKLQPQSVDFLDISDPKAVLENAMRNFSTLTKDDILSFMYNDHIYEIAVLEVKPPTDKNAISIVETDLEVDFAPPIGYVEPQRSVPASIASTRPSSALAGNIATAGQGAMAAEINYQTPSTSQTTGSSSLKPSSAFGLGGQKLSGKKSKNASPAPGTPTTSSSATVLPPPKPASKIINTSTLASTIGAPPPLRLPFGKLFFGYEIKPVKQKEGNAESTEGKVVFTGTGQTLRGDGKKTKRKERDDGGTTVGASGKGKGRAEVVELD